MATNYNTINDDPYASSYQTQYPTAVTGTDAFNRGLASQLAVSQAQRTQTGQTYADLYNQARSSNIMSGALSGQSGLSGGMQSSYDIARSAQNIGALSSIYGQRDAAMQQIALQESQAPMNALAEAQAFQQYDLAQQQAALARDAQITDIIGTTTSVANLSDAQLRQLNAMGVTQADVENILATNAEGYTEAARRTAVGGTIPNVATAGLAANNLRQTGSLLGNAGNIATSGANQTLKVAGIQTKIPINRLGTEINKQAAEAMTKQYTDIAVKELMAADKTLSVTKATEQAVLMVDDTFAKEGLKGLTSKIANDQRNKAFETAIGALDKAELEAWGRSGLNNVDDLFNKGLRANASDAVVAVRNKVIDAMDNVALKTAEQMSDDALKAAGKAVLGESKGVMGKILQGNMKFVSKALGIYGIITTVEMLAEIVGQNFFKGTAFEYGFTGLAQSAFGRDQEQIAQLESTLNWVGL